MAAENIAGDNQAGADVAVEGTSAAALKKAEENRKKRERQKAKKKAEKEAADAPEPKPEPSSSVKPALSGTHADGEAEALAASTLLSERRDAGEGRGLGMFAVNAIEAGQVAATAAPALSVVFDSAAMHTCGFCFATVDEPTIAPLVDVAICANVIASAASVASPDAAPSFDFSFGVVLDDAEGGGVVVRGFSPGSVNLGRGESALEMGDTIAAVAGTKLEGDKNAAAATLRAAATAAVAALPQRPAVEGKAAGEVLTSIELPCSVSRPSCVPCMACGKFAACRECVRAGRIGWHKHECSLFRGLPANCRAGKDTSVLRMLCRYRSSLTEGIGEWTTAKERTPLVMLTLQKNECRVPAQQLSVLSRLSGVRQEEVAAIIFAVRTNACEIYRNKEKVGCALSTLMGWHNHDCTPNAASTIGEDGKVAITTLRPIAAAEELTISYVDFSKPVDERRAILEEHYGFRCSCARCRAEQRRALKSRVPKQQGR